MRVMRAVDRLVVPWRNGQGTTTEVLRHPADADSPYWRVSIAVIDRSSAFSSFPGYQRLLMPLTGEVTLVVNGETERLARHEVLAFSGDDAVAAQDVVSVTADLNVMVDRAWGSGELAATAVDARLDVHADAHETVLLVSLSATLRCEGQTLDEGDCVVLAPGEKAVVRGPGQVAVARVTSQGGA
ncbi:hypothetical protein ASD65_12795 [Microbacterium sp. Root61]|uniref:HutD/Ves family protein n=1 Tax=Microbacterium sp. Root61 TaxID=1736570 RepID=UPI0006F95582|nr:HutD family protein [Microbacterium sp. Root61]KRA25203.1 hypothetical protein ASD65_12795 [Microbacterium sp. Root61]